MNDMQNANAPNPNHQPQDPQSRQHTDDLLEKAIHATRHDVPDADVARHAADRAWSRITDEVNSKRHAAWRRREPGDAFAVPPTPADSIAEASGSGLFHSRAGRFALAAVVAVAAALGALSFGDRISLGGEVASVHATEGDLVRLTGADTEALAPGDALESGAFLRTAPGAGAMLELPDGSRVEMDERAEIRLDRTLRGPRLRVIRGRVIVSDATGDVLVNTADGTAVDGAAVYVVNRGVLGTRVSVLEGDVQLGDRSSARQLAAGDQFSTGEHLEGRSIGGEIAWSRNAVEYAEIVAAVGAAETDVREALDTASIRSGSELPSRTPDNTLIYAAFPNVAAEVIAAQAEIFAAFRQDPRFQAELAASGPGSDPMLYELEDLLDELGSAADALGDELVIVWVAEDAAEPLVSEQLVPMLLAPVPDERVARERLEAVIRRVNSASRAVEDADSVAADSAASGPNSGQSGAGRPAIGWLADDTEAALTMALSDGVLAASPERHLVAEVAAGGGGLQGGFAESVHQAYARGVAWLGAADIEAFASWSEAEVDADEREALARSGLLDARYLVVEHRGDEGRAVLTFDGPRRGMAAWLAEPAPVGALAFISGDATLAGAFASRNGAEMFDDVLDIMGLEDTAVSADMAEMNADLGVDFRNDVAAAVGGEVAFALDGPLLPEPAWKVAVEVIEPSRLQRAMGAIVARAADEGESIELVTEAASGRTYNRVVVNGKARAVYTYVDGYLVAGPTTAQVDRALRDREDGFTLDRAPRFRALLPTDSRPHFSALWYQNLSPVMDSLVSAGEIVAGDESAEALALMGQSLAPSLSVAYAEDDQITVASRGGNGPFGLDLAGMMSAVEAMGLEELERSSGRDK